MKTTSTKWKEEFRNRFVQITLLGLKVIATEIDYVEEFIEELLESTLTSQREEIRLELLELIKPDAITAIQNIDEYVRSLTVIADAKLKQPEEKKCSCICHDHLVTENHRYTSTCEHCQKGQNDKIQEIREELEEKK